MLILHRKNRLQSSENFLRTKPNDRKSRTVREHDLDGDRVLIIIIIIDSKLEFLIDAVKSVSASFADQRLV